MEFSGYSFKDIDCCAFGIEKMANTGNLLGLLREHEGEAWKCSCVTCLFPRDPCVALQHFMSP